MQPFCTLRKSGRHALFYSSDCSHGSRTLNQQVEEGEGGKAVHSLRSNERATIVVGESSNGDDDDIDNVPDTQSTGSDELQQGSDDVSKVEAVNSKRGVQVEPLV